MLNGFYHPHWLVQWSHHCSHMCISIYSPWLPGYIDVTQTILILTIAGIFPDRCHMSNVPFEDKPWSRISVLQASAMTSVHNPFSQPFLPVRLLIWQVLHQMPSFLQGSPDAPPTERSAVFMVCPVSAQLTWKAPKAIFFASEPPTVPATMPSNLQSI